MFGIVADRRSAVRRLAGNLDSNDISDVELDKIIEIYDNWVSIHTGKTNWVLTDFEFPSLIKASDLMSSAEILDGIPREDAAKKAGDQRVAARDIIKSINKKGGSDLGQGVVNPTLGYF